MTREELKALFIREFFSKGRGNIALSETENQVLKLILDDFCDVTKDIYNLSERKLYILRKIYGIYDNGVCQSRASVARELGVSSSYVSQLANTAMRNLHYCINKYLLNAKQVADFRNLNWSLQDLESVEVPTSTKKYFESKNIHNYGDLFNISDKELLKILIEIPNIFDPILKFEILKGNMDAHIESLNLSIRAYNCLKRSNIDYLSQILSMTKEDLGHVRNLGWKSRDEILEKIHSLGLLMSWEKPLALEQESLLQDSNVEVTDTINKNVSENPETPIEKYKRLLNEKALLQQKLLELDTELAELLFSVRESESERANNDGTTRK